MQFHVFFTYNILFFTDGKVIYMQFTLPIHHENDVVNKYKETLEANPNIKIAVIGMSAPHLHKAKRV